MADSSAVLSLEWGAFAGIVCRLVIDCWILILLMKRVLLLIVIMTAVSVSASAQVGFGWGPRIGFNASKITRSGSDSHLGLTGGLFAGYNISRSFGIEVGALYSQQGGKVDNAKLRVGYFNFPILAKIPIIQGFHGYLGPQFSARLNGRVKVKDTKVKVNNMFRKWDMGGIVGLGYQFKFGLNVGVHYNFGFLDIVKDNYNYSDRSGIVDKWTFDNLIKDIDGKNGTWQVAFGWRF